MTYKQHQLTEVMCSFRFEPNSQTEWSSVFFGQYFNKLQGLGYVRMVEQKGVIVNIATPDNKTETQTKVSAKEAEQRLIFYHQSEKYAITMAKNYLSVHQIKPYQKWANFKPQIEEAILPFMDITQNSTIQSCVLAYINRWTFALNDRVSDNFNLFACVDDKDLGEEASIAFQKQYKVTDNYYLQCKLFTQIVAQNNKDAILECAGITNPNETINSWEALSDLAHSDIEKLYRTITNPQIQ